MRKVFLECVVVKQLYKFDEKSTASISKGESNTEVPFNFFKPA